MNAPRMFWYRWHRCEVGFRPELATPGWVGWAFRYPDRTTDYLPTAAEAMEATRILVDTTLSEIRNL